MESLNTWLFSSVHGRLEHHESAIRRFCPARLEQEGESSLEDSIVHEAMDELEASELDELEASELDEFVDSFINMDHTEEEYDENHGFQNKFDIAMDVEKTMARSIGQEERHGVEQGLHLVHMLLGCAEAVGCHDTKLADSMLRQIWQTVTPRGDSLQRVSYFFAMGLKSRVSRLRNPPNSFSNASLITREEKLQAFHLLHQTTPYIAFAFMAANLAICEAAHGKESLHIVDVGMEHTLQWPSLIRSLASKPEGPPKLRITGLVADSRLLQQLEAGMNAVADHAASSGIPLEFRLVSDAFIPSLLTRENLNLREGEALVFNSIMKLHKQIKESRATLKATLQTVKKLGPTALVVVEKDANHNGPFFVGRFLEALHYYSAIFDSLEASLPRDSEQRMKIERCQLGEEIENIIGCEGCDRIERHERADQWRRQLGRAGFQAMGLKCMSQARLTVSEYRSDGYTLASEKGCLLLGWKGRPVMLASAWQIPYSSSSI